MPNGIFITLKDIQIICGVKESQAAKKKRTYKDILSKKKNITILEFCKLEEITIEEFNKALQNKSIPNLRTLPGESG
jgi:UDP-N-acetyl-D-mannosaminuronate dehydrogenase